MGIKKKGKLPDGISKLNPSEMKILRDTHAKSDLNRKVLGPYDTSDAAEAVRFARKNKIVSAAAVAFGISVIVLLIIMAVFFISRNAGKPGTSDYTIVFDKKKYTVKYSDVVINGIVYFDMEKLADYCGFTVSGGSYGGKKIKYSISNEEYISFFDDSSFATINGEKVDFGDEYVAYVDGVKCKVPFDFINNAIEGIRMKLDARNNRIEVTRLHSPANKKQYAVIAFTTKNFEVVQALANVKGQKYVYNIDVNEYLKYIDPDDKGKYAFLVNRAMPLGKNYVPEDLVYLKDLGIAIGNQSPDYYRLNRTAAMALKAMLLSMEKDGVKDVYVTSAYRTYERQEQLFND